MRGKYNSNAALSQLFAQKDEIENEIGESLTWDANPDTRDKIIVIYKDADIRTRDKWDEYLTWMVAKTAHFRRVFMPRVKQLDLSLRDFRELEDDAPVST